MQVLRALQLVDDTGRDALQLVKGIGFALAGGFGAVRGGVAGVVAASRSSRIDWRPCSTFSSKLPKYACASASSSSSGVVSFSGVASFSSTRVLLGDQAGKAANR